MWEFDSGSGFEASPSVVNQTLFIGDTDGRLHALDVESGQKLWEFQTGDRISATPVVAGGRPVSRLLGRQSLRDRITNAESPSRCRCPEIP